MAQTLTVGSETFEYPENLESPGWGEEAADWAAAVSSKLTSLSSTYDIDITTASLTNNQSTAANITGLLFNSTLTRSFEVSYVVYRSTDSGYLNESGMIYGCYDGDTEWDYSVEHVGNGGIEITFTTAGQAQYQTTSLAGSNYSGTIKFKSKNIDV